MKRLLAVSIFVTGSVVLAPVARAGDADDVKAAYVEHIAHANSGNVDAFLRQHLPGHTAFGPDGGLLVRWDSLEEEKRARPDLAKPAAVPTRLRHLEVQVYGDAAVVTAYLLAPVTLADGTTRQGTRRVTSVWIKQGDAWREVHDHMSALVPVRAQ